jgi:hypothetical protein
MAITTGRVHTIRWDSDLILTTVCAEIGPAPDSAELFVLTMRHDDAEFVLAFKKSIASLLAKAHMGGHQVSVEHAEEDAIITSASIGGQNISPVEQAVHGDFYCISGKDIPDDVEIVFTSDALEVTVTPNFVRSHLVFVAELPSQVPIGHNVVQLRASGWSSDSFPIEVAAGPPMRARTLYPGAPRPRPYTLVFVANPAYRETDGSFVPDNALTRRQDFAGTVSQTLKRLFTLQEDVLRRDDIDAHMRLVTIFDPGLPPTDENALLEIYNWLMAGRQVQVRPFLERHREAADVAFLFHGHALYETGNARVTVDDSTLPGTSFTFDGQPRRHGHFPRWPGTVSMQLSDEGPDYPPASSALHEYLHAASDVANGFVADLYHDDPPVWPAINKKMRENVGDPVPPIFANYNGIDYASDPTRDGWRYEFGNVLVRKYPDDWKSYHPELIDPEHVNVMDTHEYISRLDKLTYDWLTDRLNAKVFR